MQDIFTRKEAAEYLRVSKATIIRWCKSGKIKQVYLESGVPRILKEEILKITERGCKQDE